MDVMRLNSYDFTLFQIQYGSGKLINGIVIK